MAVSSARHESIFNQGFPYYCPAQGSHTSLSAQGAGDFWHMTGGSERSLSHPEPIQLNIKVSDTVV